VNTENKDRNNTGCKSFVVKTTAQHSTTKNDATSTKVLKMFSTDIKVQYRHQDIRHHTCTYIINISYKPERRDESTDVTAAAATGTDSCVL